MGLFSGIFKSVASGVSFLGAYREAGGQSYYGGGWALERFNSIIGAHSSVDGIVEEWELADECCEYMSVDGYDNPWTQAYEEEYERAEQRAEVLSAASGGLIEFQAEDLMNWERVEMDAYKYAVQLANAWLDGSEWIPEEVLDWAWYTLSSHNG